MSALIVLALIGLAAPQDAAHPSTRREYRAPAIRPFEPPSNFGRERAEGDSGDERHRKPLAAPVVVDRYVRSYEYAPSDAEAQYEQGVASAEIRTDQSAGPLDGRWVIADASGTRIFGLVLSDAGDGLVEGGWRGPSGFGVAVLHPDGLHLEGLGRLTLERTVDGWIGDLVTPTGTSPVTLRRTG